MVDVGVGGIFWSMMLDSEKVVPQSDTAIILVDKNMREQYLIKIAFRDGFLYINSGLIAKSFNQSDKILLNSFTFNTSDRDEVEAKVKINILNNKRY
jgi:hypothetical protein